ncbi:unnamed protein product [Rhizophagus irregularis]|uniref:Uncharacterized protein n=1 Tax=Rhizophagus irregularis TaxID=588596 RepID=A0A916E080_9GLOM|nr:unnamed protein product [Rhizophagus irregularis]
MTHDTSTSKALDDYDLLGRSGLKVPQYTFGEQWGYGSNKEEMKKVFDLYYERAENFFVLVTQSVDFIFRYLHERKSPKESYRNLDESFKRLNMSYVLYVAISNTPSWELARANAIAELRGWSFLTGKYTRESAAVLKPVSRGLSVIKHSNIDEITAIQKILVELLFR